MNALKAYTIKFSGLELGNHIFDYQLDRVFFDQFDFSEFEEGVLLGRVVMEKKTNSLELEIGISGEVTVLCDISNEPFKLPLKHKMGLIVRFGDAFDDSNEEILVLPHGEFELNVAHYLYECTALAMPLKKVNPKLEESAEGRAMLRKLEALSPGNEEEEEKDDEDIDPRWDKLKDLLN